MYIKTLLILLFSSTILEGFSQSTVGLIEYSQENTEGYILFSPMPSKNTYLIDKCGEKVHEWNTSSYNPALSSFLLEDGSLLRTGQLNNPSFDEGGSGGIIEQFDWDGNLIWNYTLSNSVNCMHHDIKVLPNGNILAIVWDSYTKGEAVSNGKDSTYNQTHLWSEKIIELKPIGLDSAEIVWEWKLFDHLIQDYDNSKLNFGVVSESPELIDINYFPGAQNTADWIHLNSIDYNADLDQILVSSHRMCEVWILDHSTTTAEAASHVGGNSGAGGDLLYRWGNPQAYKRGNQTTKVLYGQHHATWVPSNYPNEGKIVIFNNGLGRPGNYSSIDILVPPLNSSGIYDMPATTAFLPAGLDWSYTDNNPTDFYSSNISGVYPLENGSFMITSGANGRFFEVNPVQQTTWEYINPVYAGGISSQGDTVTGNPVFRCEFYTPNYPGLSGQSLVSLGEIEQNPTQPSLCEMLSIEAVDDVSTSVKIYPNPFKNSLNVTCSSDESVSFTIYNSMGQEILEKSFVNELFINSDLLAPGVYFYDLSNSLELLESGRLLKL
jgi:hypothetical protein